jgi:signal-transduction protein with cAMP-binding, CBS, and nucleotidyltransferase domain
MEIAFQKYLDSYIKICPSLTAEELNFIYSNLTITKYNKKDIYLKSNDIQHEMGFVYEGLLKSYYIDDKGKKVTISFISEGSYASDYPSFIRQRPSKYFIECIEPTIMVNLPYKKIQEAYSLFKKFENYGRLIAEEILLKKQDRIESFLFENAEQRYLNFVSENKNIMNRISLTDLSSYLGIERQSLSRIRKNILKD